jgi:hypothetical protein
MTTLTAGAIISPDGSTEASARVRIAYIISAYKYPEFLARLVSRLNIEAAAFFVHVDKNTGDDVFRQMTGLLGGFANVRFVRRHRCHWGDFGHVQATLEAIGEIGRSGILYDYVILLTGQDYPIKSNRQIAAFLRDHAGQSFLHHFSLPHPIWKNDRGGLDRIAYWHFLVSNRRFAFPQPRTFRSPILSRLWSASITLFPAERRFPAGFQPFCGSGYWCLTGECVDYLYHFVQRQREFVRFFKYVHIPDEIFFHTVLLNSPLKDRVVNDDLRYAHWPTADSASPAILQEDDFERIVTVKPTSLFARKFDMTVDTEILELIDRRLLDDRAPANQARA